MRTLTMLSIALAAAAASSAADATTCYTLLDRSDNLLYRSSSPPVDMSDRGAALREGLRRRNEYLLISEADSCPAVAVVAGTTGYRPATVDEIVADMRAYASYTGGPGASGGGSAGAAPVAPASSPVAPASARSSSTAARGGY